MRIKIRNFDWRLVLWSILFLYKESANLLKITSKKDEYVFKIESNGAIKPELIMISAFE